MFRDIEMSDGTFQNLVKITRTSILGSYSWDYTSSGKFDNNWSDATLNKLLNETYYTSGTTTYNNEGSKITVNFESNGIKNDITRSMIAEIVWNLGGGTEASIYSNVSYANERGTAKCSSCTYDTTWTGKIALMYPSDYGYATDFNKCTKTLNSYKTAGCYDNDWLHQTNTYQWFLTPHSYQTNYSWFLYSTGYAGNGSTDRSFGATPVLYLNSEINIDDSTGTGTSDDPYRIIIS